MKMCIAKKKTMIYLHVQNKIKQAWNSNSYVQNQDTNINLFLLVSLVFVLRVSFVSISVEQNKVSIL